MIPLPHGDLVMICDTRPVHRYGLNFDPDRAWLDSVGLIAPALLNPALHDEARSKRANRWTTLRKIALLLLSFRAKRGIGVVPNFETTS
jgi:hypothetical protein